MLYYCHDLHHCVAILSLSLHGLHALDMPTQSIEAQHYYMANTPIYLPISVYGQLARGRIIGPNIPLCLRLRASRHLAWSPVTLGVARVSAFVLCM
jgi:hypothetical protein